MAGFYDEMAAEAQALLEELGLPVTLRRDVGGVLDPVTDAVAGGAPEDSYTTGILSAIDTRRDSIFGPGILSGDKLLTLTAQVEPLNDHRALIDGQEWSIVRAIPVAPAGIPLIYKVQVRK